MAVTITQTMDPEWIVEEAEAADRVAPFGFKRFQHSQVGAR